MRAQLTTMAATQRRAGRERATVDKPVLEAVNHPAHYRGRNGLEAIDVIEEFNLNFNIGNAVKYLLRAGRKGPRLEDIQKAAWYLERELRAPVLAPPLTAELLPDWIPGPDGTLVCIDCEHEFCVCEDETAGAPP